MSIRFHDLRKITKFNTRKIGSRVFAKFTVKPGQASPQDAINDFIIRKLNPLVVVNFSCDLCIVACIISTEFIRARQL